MPNAITKTGRARQQVRAHRKLCLLVGCLALLAAGPADARVPRVQTEDTDLTVRTTVTDRDDTPGPLDLRRVRHRIRVFDRDHVRVTYSVTTYDSFRARRLNPRWRNFVVELNRDAERGSERNVRISRKSGRLVAEVISNATRQTLTTVTATRVDARTIRISGPRHVIGARSYFWVSNFYADGTPRCGRGAGYPIVCQDVVPDDGWIRIDRWGWPESP